MGGDYAYVQDDALERIIENLEREIRVLHARGRDTSRVEQWLVEAEAERSRRAAS